MTRHLDDDQLTAALAGTLVEPDLIAHLAECLVCRRTLSDTVDAIDERREMMASEAPIWESQLETILGRLSGAVQAPRRRRWLGPLIAAAASVVLAIGTGFLVDRSGPTPVPTPVPDLQVEDVLAETDSLLADDSIPGFEAFADLSDDDLETLFETESS